MATTRLQSVCSPPWNITVINTHTHTHTKRKKEREKERMKERGMRYDKRVEKSWPVCEHDVYCYRLWRLLKSVAMNLHPIHYSLPPETPFIYIYIYIYIYIFPFDLITLLSIGVGGGGGRERVWKDEENSTTRRGMDLVNQQHLDAKLC